MRPAVKIFFLVVMLLAALEAIGYLSGYAYRDKSTMEILRAGLENLGLLGNEPGSNDGSPFLETMVAFPYLLLLIVLLRAKSWGWIIGGGFTALVFWGMGHWGYRAVLYSLSKSSTAAFGLVNIAILQIIIASLLFGIQAIMYLLTRKPRLVTGQEERQ